LCVELGAGRERADQAIDAAVGVVLLKKPGDAVQRGDAIAELHVSRRAHLASARRALLAAYSIGPRRPHVPPLVIGIAR
jgi:thymidine phosphorylase